MAKITVENIIGLIKLVFVFGVACVLIIYNFTQPRVLILHSYELDYSWVKYVNEGLMRTLKDRQDFSLYWQYMNTKVNPEESYKIKAGVMATTMIDQIKPQVIIAVDDNAQKFVGKYYINRKGISIVFCGVNGNMSDYGYDQANNVAGVHERVPVAAIHDSLRFLFDEARVKRGLRIGYLGDQSLPVKLDWDVIAAFDWAPHRLIPPIMVNTYASWQKALLELQDRADVILVSNYRQLKGGPNEPTLIPPDVVIDWSRKNSKSLILGLNGFIVEDGGDIAIAASPIEQGQKAAEIALKILAGVDPKTIPVGSTENFLVSLRHEFQEKNKHRLPMVFEAFARSMNNYFP